MKSEIKARLVELKIDINMVNIHEDGTVDVNGNVNISSSSITEIGLTFGEVTGHFNCYNCSKLVSLKGAPSSVGAYFSCGNCPKLVSLEGAPSFVGGSFICTNCSKLVSLEGAPSSVGAYFDCGDCSKLVSLVGMPSVIGNNVYINGCQQLKSLSGIDKLIKKMSGEFVCDNITSHVLGLTRIPGLNKVSCDKPWARIVNEHLHHTLACQSELLDAGLEEYAKL